MSDQVALRRIEKCLLRMRSVIHFTTAFLLTSFDYRLFSEQKSCRFMNSVKSNSILHLKELGIFMFFFLSVSVKSNSILHLKELAKNIAQSDESFSKV